MPWGRGVGEESRFQLLLPSMGPASLLGAAEVEALTDFLGTRLLGVRLGAGASQAWSVVGVRGRTGLRWTTRAWPGIARFSESEEPSLPSARLPG